MACRRVVCRVSGRVIGGDRAQGRPAARGVPITLTAATSSLFRSCGTFLLKSRKSSTKCDSTQTRGKEVCRQRAQRWVGGAESAGGITFLRACADFSTCLISFCSKAETRCPGVRRMVSSGSPIMCGGRAAGGWQSPTDSFLSACHQLHATSYPLRCGFIEARGVRNAAAGPSRQLPMLATTTHPRVHSGKR